MKQENIARTIVLLTAVLILGFAWWSAKTSIRLTLTGRMPENGGWQPGVIKAQAGKPLQLKLTSEDVVHGFAIGQMEGTEVEVLPGKVTNFSITFDHPGTYTYYCTRWCGPNHWRMRGTIEVEGEAAPDERVETAPLYLQYGMDIDAEHKAAVTPAARPAARDGKTFLNYLPEKYLAPGTYLVNSPVETYQSLREEAVLSKLTDENIWDLVAALYWKNTSPEELLEGKQLYSQNCAACHGENGGGDGVYVQSGQYFQTPANFTDAVQMLGANSALLQGKILRGGMGTGMPYWGTIFTEDQTWALVDFLWSFQFDYQDK